MVVEEEKNNSLGSEGVRGYFNQNPKIGHLASKPATTKGRNSRCSRLTLTRPAH
jgi:hypothetical protein